MYDNDENNFPFRKLTKFKGSKYNTIIYYKHIFWRHDLILRSMHSSQMAPCSLPSAWKSRRKPHYRNIWFLEVIHFTFMCRGARALTVRRCRKKHYSLKPLRWPCGPLCESQCRCRIASWKIGFFDGMPVVGCILDDFLWRDDGKIKFYY